MRAIHLAALCAAAACADAGDDTASDTTQTVTTAEGRFTLTLTPEPDPPVAGDAVLYIDILTSDGAAAAGGTVVVTPWMTAMDHGVPEAPLVTEPTDGRYRAAWVYSMSGSWDVTIDVDAMDMQDTVMVTYEVQ